jgi:hypothetical protein
MRLRELVDGWTEWDRVKHCRDEVNLRLVDAMLAAGFIAWNSPAEVRALAKKR